MILYFILFAVERAELGEEVVWAPGSQVSPASVLESKFRRAQKKTSGPKTCGLGAEYPLTAVSASPRCSLNSQTPALLPPKGGKPKRTVLFFCW